MNPVRTSRVRTVLLAAIAAFCLVTFGALPHATAAAVPPTTSGSAAPSSHAQATGHHDSEIVARTQSGSGVAEWAGLAAADLGSAGIELAVAGLLLALLLRRRRTAVRYRTGPAPARAPPLAV
jgi:hypothetical protein